MWEVRQALVAKYNAAYPTTDKALQPPLRPGDRDQHADPGRPSARATAAGCS